MLKLLVQFINMVNHLKFLCLNILIQKVAESLIKTTELAEPFNNFHVIFYLRLH